MRTLLLLSLLLSISSLSAQSIRDLYQQGVTAYEQNDYQTFKDRMFSIDSMRPNYPPVVYNLASAYALLNQKEQSLEKLNQFIFMNAYETFEEDDDFISLLPEVAFYDLLDKRTELANELPITIHQEVPILASHPESITYAKKLKAFLIGGVRDGKIWMVKEGEPPKVWAETTKDSWSVMGLEVSSDGKMLWACTSAMDNFESLKAEDKGKVSVLKYDIKKGTLLETFTLPANHIFGDLIVDKKGNVYISDGTANQLYVIDIERGELELLIDFSDDIYNLQGLCFNVDQTALFLSDYIDGIYKFDLQTKEITKLTTNEDVLLKGIDGLYYQDGTLIGMHNGTQPNRVVKYQLNGAETAIVQKTIVAQAGSLGEPTQGVFVSGKLYYIVNSPWGSYDEEGNFNVESENILIGVME